MHDDWYSYSMSRKKAPKHVVIIGAGFAGVAAAKGFAGSDPAAFAVTLIDRNPYQSFTSDYYEAATVFLEEQFRHSAGRNAFRHARGSVAVPLKEIFSDGRVSLLQGEVTGIHAEKQLVTLASGKEISFDYLVIALGSETNFYGIPHLEERALGLKSVQDALNVRNAVDELFTRVPKQDPIRVVIGGGGYTGCELAAELVGYMQKLSHMHSRPYEKAECVILEAGPSIIGSMSPWVQRTTSARLHKLGVAVHTNARVVDVTETEIVLAIGQRMPYHLLVWTAGIIANRLSTSIAGISLAGGKSCIAVDAMLRVTPHKEIYAVGDIVFCQPEGSQAPLPQTAQVAMRQGAYVAAHILATEEKKTIGSFKPHASRTIIPLGGKYAIADLGFLRFAGFSAWVLKRLSSLYYLMRVLPWGKAIRVWYANTRLYTEND